MKINLTRHELYDAIRDGVRDAFLTAMESGDGSSYDCPIIREPILQSIKEGVESAFHLSECHKCCKAESENEDEDDFELAEKMQKLVEMLVEIQNRANS